MVKSVSQYNTLTGTLTLQHPYPVGARVTAAVDVDLLSGTLERTDTQVGEWVNVIGYVQETEEEKERAGHRAQKRRVEKSASERKVVNVQAVMLWSAGAVKLGEYEKAVEMRKQMKTSSSSKLLEEVSI
ncbi:MAG: hypothetical protein Q9182_005338 [Xanthomendoza sp. 2 TL-2023]